mgnify:FL=1
MEKYKILIIEDDPIIQTELQVLLNGNGYEASAVTDFTSVMQAVKNTHPYLILLDIKLPQESGYSICSQIRSFSNVPIIFVTSCNTDMDELNSILLGGDAFITKPYNTAILLAKISSLMKRAYPIEQIERLNWQGAILHLESSTIEYDGNQAELTKNEEISEENEEIVFGEMPGFSEVAEELEKKGEYFQAIECYVKAYDQDEISYVRALEQIAENRVRLKEMEEAANCWKRILEAERKREEWFQYDGGICCRLIQFLRERGQTDEARRYAMELVQYYTSKEEQEDDHDWSCRLAGMYRLYQLETDEKRREDYWKQCETCWQHISDDYRIFEENRAYLLERLGREKTEEKRIEQAFAYMQHRTSWMDAEDNLVFLDYILKQTKGKEKFAAQEIRAFLYRSRCYLELAGNHKKEAMWDAFAALKRQKQVKNQDAYLRSFGYKMLAICYRDRYSVLDKRAEKLLEKCDYFLMTKTDAKGQKTEQQLEIWEDAARSYRDRKEDPMEEKCYQQMELLFQEMQTKGTEPRYETYKCFAEDRARCAGRQKQFQNVLQIIRKAYTLTLHEYQTPKPEDAWPNYDEETRKYYFSRDLEHYADILAEIGLQQEAFVFYSMSVIVSVEDQQDATFFDSLDVYFAGEWELLYKTFEAALHQNVTEEQIDRLSDIMDYLQYDEMKDFWNGNKTTDFRRELTWFVDTYCHGEIEFKREE